MTSKASSGASLDSIFYKPAEEFFEGNRALAMTYDDVTLATAYSEILPRETNLETDLGRGLRLPIPIVSADMDTVTESQMAIAMAIHGGLGLIHYNMPERQQLSEISRVKNHVHGLIQDPIRVGPQQTIGEVIELVEAKKFAFSTFPVVDDSGKLIGLLPGPVVRNRYASRIVADAMTHRQDVYTIRESELGSDPIARADRFFDEHMGIHKLIVVKDDDTLSGLFTISDIERIKNERSLRLKPARDKNFRLLCGAAISATRTADGALDRDRIASHLSAMIERGIDVIAVSTAHGNTRGVGDTVKLVRELAPDLPIIAGNVTSADGVDFLAKCGADSIKVGQGPGSICTTRVVAGVGIPQLTALYVASKMAHSLGVKILADGGITKSGDIVKALTLSHGVICGGMFAGCPEAPGQIMEINGKLYKQYRGMGSLAAMKAGSAARYGHELKDTNRKAAAEGIEALKEVSSALDDVLGGLVGGIQSGMGYLGASTLDALRANARYIQVSAAGQRESSPHDVVEVKTTT